MRRLAPHHRQVHPPPLIGLCRHTSGTGGREGDWGGRWRHGGAHCGRARKSDNQIPDAVHESARSGPVETAGAAHKTPAGSHFFRGGEGDPFPSIYESGASPGYRQLSAHATSRAPRARSPFTLSKLVGTVWRCNGRNRLFTNIRIAAEQYHLHKSVCGVRVRACVRVCGGRAGGRAGGGSVVAQHLCL